MSLGLAAVKSGLDQNDRLKSQCTYIENWLRTQYAKDDVLQSETIENVPKCGINIYFYTLQITITNTSAGRVAGNIMMMF